MMSEEIDELLKSGFETYKSRDFDNAKRIFERIIKLDQKNIDALSFLGVINYEIKRFDEALYYFRKALLYYPDNSIIFLNMGTVYKELGDYENAFNCYKKAIEINPDFAEAYNHIGTLFQENKQYDIAEEYYKQALSLNPDLSDAYYNIGTLFKDRRQFKKALEYLLKALRMNPFLYEGLINIGEIYKETGNLSEAIKYYKQAISINPDFADAHFILACAYLSIGDFDEGWKEYEWRWRTKEFESIRRDFKQPRWNGEDIKDKRILLMCEQGFGDAIQFIRYVKKVKEKGALVIVECPYELERLFKSVEGVDECVKYGSELPEFDVYCSLMSLPYIFKTDLKTIPDEVPYIKVDRDMEIIWKEKVKRYGGILNIGIAWAGNPRHKKDIYRTIPLSDFLLLLKMDIFTFFSLQKWKKSEEVMDLSMGINLIDLTDEINDFLDTAGLIKNLDLIITVDTAVAHLAGALGKPVWVLIPCVPDWRWMLNRSDSPWYPTMRLFRQKKRDSWDEVIIEVYEELKKLSDKIL